jgi:hypothetical protein
LVVYDKYSDLLCFAHRIALLSPVRTDNGAPFAGTGLLGLSKLSLGWMKLGIVHERIQAGRPQQNGRHERMHRTLKEDTTKPPATSLRAQQSRFDNFRYLFNNERPHEGLNNQVPASLYIPSSIRMPRKLPEFTYPNGLLLRRVNNSGDISWHKNRVFISEVFRFEELGVELITPGLYRVFFRDMEIGELNSEESFALGLLEESSEPVDERIRLDALIENSDTCPTRRLCVKVEGRTLRLCSRSPILATVCDTSSSHWSS